MHVEKCGGSGPVSWLASVGIRRFRPWARPLLWVSLACCTNKTVFWDGSISSLRQGLIRLPVVLGRLNYQDGLTGHHVGNPVRQEILDRHGASYIPPGDYPMDLLVIGGSQGARILSDVVPTAVGLLPDALRQNLRISQQAREEDCERVLEAYAEIGVRADVQSFFKDIPARMSLAQLVISRSGASSVAEISTIGRPAIFVPLAAAIRDEQIANAARVGAGGRG